MFSKILFGTISVVVGYGSGSIARAVEQSNTAFYVGFFFGAIVVFFTLAAIFDDDAPCKDNPSFLKRIAPLAFLYWLGNRKD